MLTEETIELYAEVGRRMAKQAEVQQVGASNRMSAALDAVRTKMGATGGPKSTGRIPGAPSLHAPTAQGVQQPHAERAPNLGFPSVPKPPSRV
jgi:hypothetical protein